MSAADPMAISHLGHERQIADMAAAVLQDRPPAIPGNEAREAVLVVEAAYHSARTGRPVSLQR